MQVVIIPWVAWHRPKGALGTYMGGILTQAVIVIPIVEPPAVRPFGCPKPYKPIRSYHGGCVGPFGQEGIRALIGFLSRKLEGYGLRMNQRWFGDF